MRAGTQCSLSYKLVLGQPLSPARPGRPAPGRQPPASPRPNSAEESELKAGEMERLLQRSGVTEERARAELGPQHGGETTGVGRRGDSGLYTQTCNLAPPAWWGRTKGSTAGIFLLAESVWDLQAMVVGGKSTVALLAPASLHPLAGGAGGQAQRWCQYFSHHTD